MEYALKSKCINNKPEVNQKTTQKALIKELNKEIAGLKMQVEALREEKGVFLPPDMFKEMEGKILSQTSLIDMLNDQIKCAEDKCKETEQLFIAKETQIKTQYNEEIQALFDKIGYFPSFF